MLKFLRRRERPRSGDGGMSGEQALAAVKGRIDGCDDV
jgi:hypothetical protein